MTKYIIPIFDNEAFEIWIETINASSLNSAKEKFINKILTDYEIDEDYDDWSEFVDRMEEFNIIIGNFEDIETL